MQIGNLRYGRFQICATSDGGIVGFGFFVFDFDAEEVVDFADDGGALLVGERFIVIAARFGFLEFHAGFFVAVFFAVEDQALAAGVLGLLNGESAAGLENGRGAFGGGTGVGRVVGRKRAVMEDIDEFDGEEGFDSFGLVAGFADGTDELGRGFPAGLGEFETCLGGTPIAVAALFPAGEIGEGNVGMAEFGEFSDDEFVFEAVMEHGVDEVADGGGKTGDFAVAGTMFNRRKQR